MGCRALKHTEVAGRVRSEAVEVVYIATPIDRHVEDSLLCLRADKAVLCEKSMAEDNPLYSFRDGVYVQKTKGGPLDAVFQRHDVRRRLRLVQERVDREDHVLHRARGARRVVLDGAHGHGLE